MDLLLSNRVDATFNDSLSYLDYKSKSLTLKSRQLKVTLRKTNQHSLSKKVDDKTVQKFNDGLKKIEESGELKK